MSSSNRYSGESAVRIRDETAKTDGITEGMDLVDLRSGSKNDPTIAPSPLAAPHETDQDTLDKQNVLQQKAKLECSIFLSVITGLILSALPIAVILATLAAYDDQNRASGLVLLMFGGGGLAVLAVVWRVIGDMIAKESATLNTLKETYPGLLSKQEIADRQKKKRKSRLKAVCLVAAVLAGCLSLPAIRYAKLSYTYHEAVLLTENGFYEEAEALFREIEEKHFLDTDAYLLLCGAYLDYNQGDVSGAHYNMSQADFSHLSPEQSKSVESFRAKLEAEYDDYLENLVDEEDKAYRNRVTNGVPFVGMFERDIANTSLGLPSDKVRHTSEWKNGKQYQAKLYDFMIGNTKIFTARCVKGIVTNVWDFRDNPVVAKPGNSSHSHSNDDPYGASDYSDAEDFYYDYADEFFDFSEAEEYFNEHQE